MLSSNKSDLQYALDQFSYACLDAGMKISMAKTEIMWSVKAPCPDQKMEKFKYLGVIFLSDSDKTEIVCLSRHTVPCSFQTNRVTLKQIKK